MSITDMVRAGRAQAERLMTDTCTVRHKTGQTFDENTGKYVDTYEDRYDGKCRVQTRELQPANPESAGWTATVTDYVVSVPITVTDVEVDDVVQVTDSALDPALVGRSLRVTSVEAKSHATARRLRCEVIEA